MRPPTRQHKSSAMDLMEEATHLLRRTPATAWLAYCVAVAPFLCYLFFFWSDMSRSSMAEGHLPEAAALLALLYWWMKVWQAIYCSLLVRILEGKSQCQPMKWRGWLRLWASQAWIHATMPWVFLVGGAAIVPTGWIYSFYHNVTVLAVEHYREGGRTKALLAKAINQTQYRALQNHMMILLLTVTAMLVYLNIFLGFALGAGLLKIVTGFDNEFTRNSDAFGSSPIQILFITCAYLCMWPIVKAVYVLRCFYGQARKSGADLQAELRRLSASAVSLALAALCLASPAAAAQEASGAPPPVPRARELNHSLDQVLRRTEYQWRFPREHAAAQGEESWLGSLINGLISDVREQVENIMKFLRDLFRSIFHRPSQDHPSAEGDSGVSWLPQTVTWLAVAVLVVLAILLVRSLVKWKRMQPKIVSAPAAPDINLESEGLLASQLSENEWLRLAREKIAAGELRLALRALFLATLARLGEMKVLQVSRTKSNGDYLREMGWRARGRANLWEDFSEQVRVFERSWYGWHEVTAALVARFEEQHQRIISHAA